MDGNDSVPETPPRRVLVLGGTGFIGRHVVGALLARGLSVAIGTRDPARTADPMRSIAPACPRRRIRFEELQSADRWRALLAGFDVVVNCVGILRERRGESYEQVHHIAPGALAVACRETRRPLFHVSALGLDSPCRSGFLRSKQRGEAAVRGSGTVGAIIRPSLLDAPSGGYGARWIRFAARLPLSALPADATGRIAAMDVRDLGDAIAALVAEPCGGWHEYDFGGANALPLRDYIAMLRRALGRPPAVVVPVPGWLARALAHLCDVLRVSPYSYGHWELLRRDNCPVVNHLPGVLGRTPRVPGQTQGVAETAVVAACQATR